MKNILLLLAATFFIISCSEKDPMTSTLGEFMYDEELQEKVSEKLDPAENDLLFKGITKIMLDKEISPADTTEVKSINTTLSEILESQNARQKELEDIEARRDSEIDKMNKFVQIKVKGKDVPERDATHFRAIDFELINVSDKDIKKVNIVFHVRLKQNDKPVANLTYAVDMPFPAGKTMETTAFWEFNQFDQQHIMFKAFKYEDMTIESFATSITFSDGEVVMFDAPKQVPAL